MAATSPIKNIDTLRAQVGFLETGHGELRRDMRNLDSKMDAGFDSLSRKLDTKSAPQWQPISIGVTILLAIGAALYYPVREAISENKAQIEAMRIITDDRARRLWEDQNKTARELSYLQGQLHPLIAPAAK